MLNKLVLRVVLALSLAVSGAANAALITQDIISDNLGGVIGSVTIDTNDADAWGEITDWVSFDFFGYYAEPLGYFWAEIDTFDFSAGILSLDFDITDVCAGCEWAYNGYVDDSGGTLDIFDVTSSGFIYYTDDLRFGGVSVVPEPSALILLLTGLVVFSARRKVNK